MKENESFKKKVKNELKKIKFPKNRIVINEGFFNKNSAENFKYPKKISFAYIDFDFYQPTFDALNVLEKIIVKNGIIIVDDYDFFSTGVKKAVEVGKDKKKFFKITKYKNKNASFIKILKMYKILIDHTIFLHQRNGGISKYFSRLYQVNKKFKNGLSLNIFCPITINENLYNIRGLKNLYFFKIKKIPKFCTQLFYFINNLLSIIYVNINKPDLLHISYFNYQITKFTKIPYVLTIHDLIHEKYFKKK